MLPPGLPRARAAAPRRRRRPASETISCAFVFLPKRCGPRAEPSASVIRVAQRHDPRARPTARTCRDPRQRGSPLSLKRRPRYGQPRFPFPARLPRTPDTVTTAPRHILALPLSRTTSRTTLPTQALRVVGPGFTPLLTFPRAEFRRFVFGFESAVPPPYQLSAESGPLKRLRQWRPDRRADQLALRERARMPA